MNISDLIQQRHTTRRAAIYIRQSSPQQVLTNQESLRLQYALKQRATELGWHESSIDIIDSDLGHTAATTAGRTGFQQLVARVALGEIGILIAYDATRLARNCSHWYQLLDLCGHSDCLIADRDGVYDPGSINGRLLLGLKGQISELELHTLRARLTAGILNKARRGELALTLPTGLVRLASNEVIKHPDREVQDRITLIFRTFFEKRSVAQVVRFFHEQRLQIPRRGRLGDILWKRPTVAGIVGFLKNPAYAGAFVYGRNSSSKNLETGKSQQKPRPVEQWKVCLRDRYPAYISWDEHERIRAMLRDNHSEYDRNKTRGVPREGKALLHGIVYCGECGHKLCVQYKQGTRYVCNYLRQQTGEPVCQYLHADTIDDHVVRCFFEVLSVAEIDLAANTLREIDRQRSQRTSARGQELERLRYRARLAERQFHAVDPDNRLVAGELEQRWEQALRELRQVEQQLADEERNAPVWAIPADLLEALKNIGPHLPELWNQGLLRAAQKKALLRALIDKVVVRRLTPDRVRVRVVWRGGAASEADIVVPVKNFRQMSGAKEIEAAIVALARAGKNDMEIAQEMTERGHRSPMGPTFLRSTVQRIRLTHGIMTRVCQSHPKRVRGYWTVPQLAKKLGVQRHWLYDRINNGTIQVEKDPKTRGYLFPSKAELLRQFRQLVAGKITKLGCGKGYQDA